MKLGKLTIIQFTVAVILIFALSILLCGRYAHATEVNNSKTGYISAVDGANLRTKPSKKNSKVVKVLSYGKKVKYSTYESNKKWVVVKYKTKNNQIRYGYVAKKLISSKKPSNKTKTKYSASYFMRMGVIHWNGYRWTWYSEHELSGGGLHIPGRHVGAGDYIYDKDGYICVASSDLKKGTVVKTPFGANGKVYDCGCASGTIDVYVSW